MCYFLYVATNEEIPENVLNYYQSEHEIYINKNNEYMKEEVSQHYYLIHRQCSCDFIQLENNNFNEITDLFNKLTTPFEVILLDQMKQPNIEIDDVIADRTLLEIVSLKDFLFIYPTKLISSKIYSIT